MSWLEITCEPEETTFRDEGGSLNYLCAFFVLRGEAPKDERELPVQLTLEYDDGSPVASAVSKPALRLLGNAASGKPKEGPAVLDCRTRVGSVRYKILKLSRNHDGRRFRVRVSLAGAPETRSAVTRPTLVLSKRKWLKAEERTPENAKREEVETRACKQNEVLARLAGSKRAAESPETPLLELAGLDALEELYPRHASQEEVGKVVGKGEAGRGVKRERSESVERHHSHDTRRKSPRSEPAQAGAMEIGKVLGVLKRLEDQIGMYNRAVVESKKRLEMVESENAELRERVEDLEAQLAAPSHKSNPIKQVGPPLALSRVHSLVGVDGDFSTMLDFTPDAANIFGSAPRGQLGLEP